MITILLFAGTAIGAGLLVAGLAAMNQGDSATAWKYIVGALAALAFTIARGRKLRREIASRRQG